MVQMRRRLGDLEAAVVDVLWDRRDPASVRQVLEEVNSDGRSLAYTTVMTVLENLHRKGFVTRERAGRAWFYSTAQSREQYTASVMGEALASGADREAALLRFVESMSPVELQRLRALIDDLLPGPQPGARKR